MLWLADARFPPRSRARCRPFRERAVRRSWPRFQPQAFQNRDSCASDYAMTRCGDELLARLLDAIAHVLLRDIGLHRFRRGDVDLPGGILIPQLGQPATVQRESELGIDA